jgi:hypothetical protein
MPRSSVLTSFAQILGAATLIQFGFLSPCLPADVADSGQTKVSLHWFDGQSQLVEIGWKSTSHWVWKFTDAGVEPTSEIEIAIPAQIHINSVEHADNADFKIIETSGETSAETSSGSSPGSSPGNSKDTTEGSAPEDSAAQQSLAIETREPKIAAKLNIVSDTSGTESTVDRGLLVTLEPQSTAVLIHGSCSKYGLTIREGQKTAGAATPLYVGATCQSDKGDLLVRWHLPEDFAATSSNKLPVPDSGLRVSTPNPKSSPAPQQISVSHKGSLQPIEYLLRFEPIIAAEKVVLPAQKKEEAKPRPLQPTNGLQFTVLMAPAYVGYPSPGSPNNNSSANNINLGFRLEQTQSTRRSLWETQLEVPAFSIFPGPLHFPASGVYSLSSLLVVPPFTQTPDSTFAVLAGLSLHEVHLELNSQASGFLMGPKLAFSLADKTRKSLGGRAYSATFAAVALWSPDRGSFFNSYAAMASFSYELSRNFFFGKRVDLLTEAAYFNLLSRDGTQVGVTTTSLGLQVWL